LHYEQLPSGTKVGRLIALKAADLLHYERPPSGRKVGRFIAL